MVGTGFLAGAHVTEETLALIREAERLFYLVSDPVTGEWLEEENPEAESLSDAYAVGKPRAATYREIRERILAAVRRGLRVCAVFYGHPGVFVQPSHAAVEQARREGFPARMLPGISAEDCLFADLEIDPLEHGCQSFEATHFLWGLRFDPKVPLVLWQAGIVGVTTTLAADQGSPEGLRRLEGVLLRHYLPDHRVVAYEAPLFGVLTARADEVPVARLHELEASVTTTLYVPPLGQAEARGRARPAGPLKLVVAGSGYSDGQLTSETRISLERAGEPFVFDGQDALGKAVTALRRGATACALYPGHPCFGQPSVGPLLAAARSAGFAARILPGISGEDCLFAALGFDPGATGRVLFSAVAFPGASPTVEPGAPLVLLDPGRSSLPSELAAAIRRLCPGRERVTRYRLPGPGLAEGARETLPLERLSDAEPGGPTAYYLPPA